jgi:CYTH domain-containing protein
MKLQKLKEEVFGESAYDMKNSKVLIVCDRGMLDNKAYMKEAEFRSLLQDMGTNETEARDEYDAVFHLVTAAKGKEEVYTLANNAARTETIEQAREKDDQIIAAWTGHPQFRIIDNSTEFEEKLERLLKEISSFLGEPEPYEIERKYLIQYPDIKKLESMSNCSKVNITKTYLKCEDGKERRIRARGNDGEYIYYLTEKTQISPMKRVEIERKLTQDEYLKYLMEADTKLHTIKKTRYCLTENSKYYEIDIYPEWDKQAIIEIELNDENEKVEIPDYIKVIKEVTEDENYRNYNMSSKMPDQMI